MHPLSNPSIFQHLYYNVYALTPKKWSEHDADLRALALCMVPIMGNHASLLALFEYFYSGKVGSASFTLYATPLVLFFLFMYIHAYSKLKVIEDAYQKYTERKKETMKIATLVYWFGSLLMMFVIVGNLRG